MAIVQHRFDPTEILGSNMNEPDSPDVDDMNNGITLLEQDDQQRQQRPKQKKNQTPISDLVCVLLDKCLFRRRTPSTQGKQGLFLR